MSQKHNIMVRVLLQNIIEGSTKFEDLPVKMFEKLIAITQFSHITIRKESK